MKKVLILILSLALFGAVAQPKQICVTVDDLPTVDYGEGNQEEITRKLISHFKKYTIPAIGFVNEGKLYESGKLKPERVALLRQWLDNGYELGNHTYAHTDYHLATFADFSRDVLKGAQVTPGLSTEAGLAWRYFRHPYLHIGQSKARYDSLTTFLTKEKYTEAPVTIDNEDYLFAKAYSNAHKNKDMVLMQRIGSDYVKYMEAKAHFYERASATLFGRQIPQTLLIHASLLNADYVDDLAQMYQRIGYTFVELSKALQDKAYEEVITKFGSYGISWIDRWALSRSVPKEFFAGDPATPAYIVDAAR